MIRQIHRIFFVLLRKYVVLEGSMEIPQINGFGMQFVQF